MSKKAQGFKGWIVGIIVAIIFLTLFILFATEAGEKLKSVAAEITQRMVGL